MKYIRTRDGRIIDAAKEEITLGYHPLEADNIEELCDRFVLVEIDIIILNKEHTQYRFEGNDEWFDITETELKRGICGAIWTDKGLIFKAKMKGVLPNGEIDWELL